MTKLWGKTLNQIPEFSHLSPSQFEKLQQITTITTFPKNQQILDRRGMYSFLIIVQSGEVEVLDENGQVYVSLGEGDWFYNRRYSRCFQAYSRSQVEVALIPYSEIKNTLGLPATNSFTFSASSNIKLIRPILLYVLPILLAAMVTLGLWRLYAAEYSPTNEWQFKTALLPYLIGDILLSKNNTTGAAAHYQQSLKLNPEYSPAHNALGTILYQQGMVDAAITHWREAIKYDHNFLEAYINLGLALGQQKKFSEAASMIQAAIQLSPDDPILYRTLGEIERKQENIVQARRAYLEASRLDQNNADIFYTLGYLYLAEQNYDRATKNFEQALTLNPNLYLAKQGLGKAYFEQGQFEQALDYFAQASLLHPDDPTPLFYTGVIYEKRKLIEPAKEAFRQVIRLDAPESMIDRAVRHIQRLATKEKEEETMVN